MTTSNISNAIKIQIPL